MPEPDEPDVLGAAEVAEMLGISRQMVNKIVSTDPTFPRGKLLAGGRIWRRADVERWAKRTGRLD